MAFGKKKDIDYKPVDEENPYVKKSDDKFQQMEPKKFNPFPTKPKRFLREEAIALR